jgi:hypothetical protein
MSRDQTESKRSSECEAVRMHMADGLFPETGLISIRAWLNIRFKHGGITGFWDLDNRKKYILPMFQSI